jgi:hypothetical protein
MAFSIIKCGKVRKSPSFSGTINLRSPVGGQMQKVTVLLTDDLKARFHAFCTERGYKQSTLIARLVREHLDREGFASQRPLFDQSGGIDKND